MATTTPCAHCGLPAPASPSGLPSFCCAGCKTVWELLHEVGLDHYYDLRERLEGDALAPGLTRAEQAAELPGFAHLDDARVQQAIGEGKPGRAELHLVGLHCAACVWLIERLPEVLPGVRTARVGWSGAAKRGREAGTARLVVEWDPARLRLSAIAAFLHRAGYEVHAIDAEAEAAERRERRRELIRIAVAGASAGNVMLVSVALYAGGLQDMDAGWTRFFEWAALLLALPALTWAAMPFYRAAWAGLRMGRLHIDLPIALGLIGGFVASVIATIGGDPFDHREVYFDSVSVLVFLLLVGRWVQRRGQRWALSRTDLLQRLLPARARRLGGEDVAATALAPGDAILVLPGEGIPADARVVAGRGSVDASSLTGESLPLAVEVGDHVLAGTRNLQGRLELIVEAAGDATRIGSLAARIMQADRSRAPIQRTVDRISGWFVAAVLLLALVGGLAWWSTSPERAFAVVVALLVVSCPCALGLATPVALAVARGRAAERGILFASAGAIEVLAKTETAVFDKTGTLTEGELRVVDVAMRGSIDERELAGLLRAIEGESGHPIAQALRRWAERRPSSTPSITAIEELPGLGRAATIAGARVRVGSVGWLGHDLPSELAGVLEPALARGETAVLVEREGDPLALLSLADTARADAPAALERLRRLGLQLAIRSGDHPRTVAALAERLQITDRAGACSPEAKAEQLAAWPGPVAMIGDGVNDAPAMRAAGVGVAVRGGAEVALRVADVHLARPGVSEVAELFEGSRRTMRVVHRNLGFSLIYNLLFASLALAGRIDPLTAALLMPASSLTVLLSSALARTFVTPTKDATQSLHAANTVRPARSS
ncbi:heavy metal translocating P-type ATPase [Nannocystaceae bacterium ST9]